MAFTLTAYFCVVYVYVGVCWAGQLLDKSKDPIAPESKLVNIEKEDLIIGGVPCTRGKWPWMVAIDSDQYGYICGAALIDKHWAITAAHCVHRAPVQLYVFLGLYNRTARDAVQRIAASIIIHPGYSRQRDNSNDVALLRLHESANLDHPYVDVIQLPASDQKFSPKDECWMIGWGRKDPGNEEPMSDVLLERRVAVMSNSNCQNKWNGSIFRPAIYRSNICVDEGKGDISTCQGDSGGPLHCYDKRTNRYVIAGTSSWGSAACRVYPSVFTRLSSFRRWIDKNIRP